MSAQRAHDRRPLNLLAVALAALVIGCTDAPSNLDWDHTYAAGLIVREDGVVRVTVDKKGEASGSITVGVGRQTGQLDVTFLDEKGAVIVPADDEYLDVTVTYTDMVVFQQATPGAFTGRFQGLKAGETRVFFTFKQGTVGAGKGHGTPTAIKLEVTQ